MSSQGSVDGVLLLGSDETFSRRSVNGDHMVGATSSRGSRKGDPLLDWMMEIPGVKSIGKELPGEVNANSIGKELSGEVNAESIGKELCEKYSIGKELPGEVNAESIGKELCEKYWEVFMTDRKELKDLYTENSAILYEGTMFKGDKDIISFLECLPKVWKPSIHDIDCIRCGSSDNVTVQVTGVMHTSERSYFSFCQSLHLVKNLEGKYYVANEIFCTTK